MDIEEGLDVVDEFYNGESDQVTTESSQLSRSNDVISIKQGLRQSVKALG